MIGKTKCFLVILTILLSSCSPRKNLIEPVQLYYSNKDMVVKINLTSIDNGLKRNDAFHYGYYGTMEANLKLNTSEPYLLTRMSELGIIYKNKRSRIYEDTIGDYNPTYFWGLEKWNKNGFRKDKIYIVFDDKNIDWSQAKIVELGKE